MKIIIEDIKSRINNYFPKLFSSIQGFPFLSLLLIGFSFLIFSLSVKSESLAKAFAATGTMSAVIWALFHQLIKEYLDRPDLQIESINLDYLYLRSEQYYLGNIDYYIDIQLINKGKRTAYNCTPILSSIFKVTPDGKWGKIINWIPLPLHWAADEREFEDIVVEGTSRPSKRKIARAERNIVPNRPYFFNLGMFNIVSFRPNLCQFILLTYPQLKAPKTIDDEGYYCYELKIIAEEIKPLIKYIYLEWHYDYKNRNSSHPEKPDIIIWEIKDSSPI